MWLIHSRCSSFHYVVRRSGVCLRILGMLFVLFWLFCGGSVDVGFPICPYFTISLLYYLHSLGNDSWFTYFSWLYCSSVVFIIRWISLFCMIVNLWLVSLYFRLMRIVPISIFGFSCLYWTIINANMIVSSLLCLCRFLRSVLNLSIRYPTLSIW